MEPPPLRAVRRIGPPVEPPPRRPLAPALAALAAAAALAAPPSLAASGQAWVLRSRSDFGDLRLEDLTLSPEGRLSLAPAVTKLAEIPQPFVWCLAMDPKGRVHAAGGNEGQVVRLGEKGVEVVLDAPELEVHAIAFDGSGRLFAATSPDGKVYRAAEGAAPEVFFDPESTYIWALAFDGAGNLLVATGQPGRVFRVSPDGKAAAILEAREDHVRALAPDGAGGFYAGSDEGGVIYRIPRDGKASVLYDSPVREISALAVLDGNVYAAALTPAPRGRSGSGGSAGAVTRVRVTAEGGGDAPDEPEGQQDASQQQQQQRQPPPESYTGAVYRITPQGYARKIWESRDALPLSLLPGAGGALLVGTGDRGRLFSLSPAGEASEVASLEASQVNALLRAAGGTTLAGTSNLGAIFQISGGYAREGSLLSGTRDAGFTSTWGRMSWDADVPAGAEIEISVRTGDTEDPDGTWSEWSAPRRDTGGFLIDRPSARYLQWKATFRSRGDASPVLKAVQIHYLPQNMPPEIETVEVQGPGVWLQSTGTPTQGGEEGGDSQRRSSQPKRSFQRGMRSVGWKATDANGDPLRAEVQYRAEDETAWKTLESGVEEDFFAWDSTAMPDGAYRLRLIVTDAAGNPPGQGLTAQRESAPFDVDNTPPSVTDLKARLQSKTAEVTAAASDSFSAIAEAAYSVDADEWVILVPEDGIADASRESFRFMTKELAPGEHSVVVRAKDRAGNVSSSKVIVKVP